MSKYALPFPVTVHVEWTEMVVHEDCRISWVKKGYTQKGAYVETHVQTVGGVSIPVMEVMDEDDCHIKPKRFPQVYMKIYNLWQKNGLQPYPCNLSSPMTDVRNFT